jgi:hypothetical protein
MNPQQIQVKDNILKRILLLYGLYSLLSNAFFTIGYYFLPEGFLRGSPQMVPGEFVAQQTGFWAQFGMTLFFNLGFMTVIILLMNVILKKVGNKIYIS